MRNTLQAPGHPVLSLTAEYALRAVLALARAGRHRPLPADEIARRIGAPANYMSKTLNVLAKEGIVASRRGPAGGFTLARAPESITVQQVAEVFSSERAPARCLLGDRPCDPHDPCAAHARWTAVLDAARAPFGVSIAELISEEEDRLAG